MRIVREIDKEDLEKVEKMLLGEIAMDYEFILPTVHKNTVLFFEKIFSEENGFNLNYVYDEKVFHYIIAFLPYGDRVYNLKIANFIYNEIVNDNINDRYVSLVNEISRGKRVFINRLAQLPLDKLVKFTDRGFIPSNTFFIEFIKNKKEINAKKFHKLLNVSELTIYEKNSLICKYFANCFIETILDDEFKVSKSFLNEYIKRIETDLFSFSTFKRILNLLKIHQSTKYIETIFIKSITENKIDILKNIDISQIDINSNYPISKTQYDVSNIKDYIAYSSNFLIISTLIDIGYNLDDDFLEKLYHRYDMEIYIKCILKRDVEEKKKLPHYEKVLESNFGVSNYHTYLFQIVKSTNCERILSKVLNKLIKMNDFLSIFHLFELGYNLSSENVLLLKKNKQFRYFENILENRYPKQYNEIFHHFL